MNHDRFGLGKQQDAIYPGVADVAGLWIERPSSGEIGYGSGNSKGSAPPLGHKKPMFT